MEINKYPVDNPSPTVRFSLFLNSRVPVEKPPPQSSYRLAGGGVKCVCSFVTDSLITCLVFWNKKWLVHGPRNKTWYHVTSWMTLGSLRTVRKFVVMKKSTSAIQEFLESGSNEVYHNPEGPQQVLGNLTRKYGSRIDLKLSIWQMFIRIRRRSLQTSVLKAGWGHTYERYNCLDVCRL